MTRSLALRPLAAFVLLAAVALAQPPLTSVRIASGLMRPVCIGSPPGDYDRLFVLEQHTGLVRIIKDGALLPTPFLNVRSRIVTASERGLLGLAFHPQYATNGYFYLDYTRSPDGALMVERFTVSATDPDVADPSSGVGIIGPITHPQSNHNGGCIAFGPDGYLYMTLGDGGGAGDPNCNAQNRGTLLGKILRLDVDGGFPYAIPVSNPYATSNEFRREIWTYGWRNPWRMSFDRLNGDMYVGDVGQGAREEISFQAGSSSGGLNFGWKIMEGTTCFGTANCVNPPPCNGPGLRLPIHEYNTGSNCAVVGGHVYRGCAIPGLEGTYFFADHCSGRIWSLRYNGVSVSQFTERTTELRPNVGTIGTISSFGEDCCGEIYITDLGGEVFKIVPAAAAPATSLGFATPGSNGVQPVFAVCGLLGAGQSADFQLRDALPLTAAALLLSNSNNPFPLPFGTIVPVPPLLVVAFATDAQGQVVFSVAGGAGPAVVFGQWGVLDPGATAGVALSNALQVTFP